MSTKVLVVGADPALAELLEEWLAGENCHAASDRPDLVLVDLPFPRERGRERLASIEEEYPGTLIVAMPKPLTRDAFIAALRRARDEVQ